MLSITLAQCGGLTEIQRDMSTGWKLTVDCRERLLARFAPRYARTIADHVTLLGGDAGKDADAPSAVGEASIVGRADDDAGVEAYVVAIDGATERPDGSRWHVTWSLEPGRGAKESNDVIAERGWTTIDPPVPLDVTPAKW